MSIRRVRSQRQRLASIGAVSACGVALVVLAMTYDGYAMTDVDLNDSGIWVTRASDNLLGRFNYAAGALDGSLRTESTQFDVLQEGLDVVSRDTEMATATVVDPAALAMGSKTTLAADFQLRVGGGRAAIYDAASGSLWTMDTQGVAGFAPASTPIAAELEPGGALAVGVDGTAYVVQPATARLTVVRADGATEELKQPGLEADTAVALTVVGTTPVVLDRDGGLLHLAGTKSVGVQDGADVVLQAPAGDATAVVYATKGALVSQPLDGSAAQSLDAATGVPAEPVVVAGCAYGVWNGSLSFVRDCPGTADDQVSTVPDADGATQLRFRVNNGHVVLNDLTQGGVWLVADQLQRVDDWQDVMPDDSEGDQEQEQTLDVPEDQMPDRTQDNHPPVANDDSFGVRPGRTTVLPVVDNDVDEDGDLLTVELVGDGPRIGALQGIYAGTALQVTVAQDAAGSDVFRYRVSDGRGGTDEAEVHLEVHPWDQNKPPEQLRQGSVIMAAGQSATSNVLPNWRDPDGDDIYLVSATATTEGDSVQFRPDGQVTFQDSGHLAGKKTVAIQVSDGTDSAEGTVVFDVRPSGALPPVANPDHVVGYVGREITVAPLANDTDPSGLSLRLARLQEVPTATVVPDYQAGTFTILADTAQTVYLTYTLSNGPATAEGLVRVDITDPPQDSVPPVAVGDVALVPAGGSVMVDVLANDVDPAGGVLVLQATDVASGSPLAAAVVDHRYVKVSELRAFSEPVQFTYTVSNGVAFAQGQVTAIPVAAPAKLRPPVANDDEVNVRVGDIVTIDVLANDYHPGGAALKLLPDLAELPDPATGLMFTSGNRVRFHAGTTATTVTAVYQVTDEVNEPDSARITVHILPADADRNSPPRPKALEARTLSDQTVRIQVPLNGIDPEGDYTTLVGIEKAPTKGTASVGDTWIDYTAGRDQVGLDTFTYLVEDRLGARASATVLVGIAPQTGLNHPPVPVDDKVWVRPDRSISIPVLANDVDPDGDTLHLVEGSLDAAEVPGATSVRIAGDRIALRTPDEEGAYTLHYTVADPYGAEAVGAAVLEVGADAPLRAPIAADDIVTADQVVGHESVNVPVLDNDEDPDGARDELTVALVDPHRGTVRPDKTVDVPVTDELQIIDYQVTDVDGLVGHAFIIVPAGTGAMRPALNPHARPLEVKAGESLTFKLADQVMVADGKRPIITEASSLTALGGVATLVGNDQITYAAAADYSGRGSVSVEVTDGTGPDDPQGQRVPIQIPITVLPQDNQPPTFTSTSVEVAAGEQVEVDLTKLATDPDADDVARLSFALTNQAPTGLNASLSGGTLTVAVEKSAAKGTTATLAVTVTDGKSDPVPASVLVTVVSSKLPLPKAVDDVIPSAVQGKAVDVAVLSNDSNPFPDEPLRLISAAMETGDGLAEVTGQTVRVTPGPDFVGTLVVRYRIGDATLDPDREVDGRIEVTVKGRPDPVVGLSVGEVADRSAVLSWQPAQNNGSPITNYQVTATAQGYSLSCGIKTTCTLSGLTNNTAYAFQVVATNAVGDSDPSTASAEVRPDAVPDAPVAPTVRAGNKSLAVNWVTPASPGSPVQSYNLQIDPAPASGQTQKTQVTGNSLTWDGVTNGASYRVRVCALNKAAGACTQESHWSQWSSTVVPAGPPDAPAAPTVTRLDPVGTQSQLKVDWKEPAANGDPIASYTLTVLRGGSVINTIKVPGGTKSQTVTVDVNQSNYTFTVTATNKAGTSAASAPSAPVRAFATPGKVTNLAAQDMDNSAKITFTPAAGNGAQASEISYMYQVVETGATGTLKSGDTIPGLANNGTYSIRVWARATIDGASSDGAAVSVGGIRPYGKPLAPSVALVPMNGPRIEYHWSAPRENGRPIEYLEYRFDGGSWIRTDFLMNEWVYLETGYSETHTIEMRAVDSLGNAGAIARDTATSVASPAPKPTTPPSSPPPPIRTVTVSKGAVFVDQSQRCYDTGPCYYMDGQLSGFDAYKTYTGQCFNKNGAWKAFTVTTDVFGNADVTSACWIGNGYGANFWWVVDGVESNHVSWGVP